MASLVDLLPVGEPRPVIDPASRRLAVGILKQALIDCRAGRQVFVSALEPWGILAGIRQTYLVAAFERIRSGDPMTLTQVRELAKARNRTIGRYDAEQRSEIMRERWDRTTPEQRRAFGAKLRATWARKREANGR
jgi:hypothetical protein